jgi:hypothetical protein
MPESISENQPMNSGNPTPTTNIAAALESYRKGNPAETPFQPPSGQKKTVSADAQSLQDATKIPAPDNSKKLENGKVQLSEKDFDPNANTKNSDGKEKTDESTKSEVSPKSEEPASEKDDTKDRTPISQELAKDTKKTPDEVGEANTEEEVSNTDNEVLKRLDALELAETRKAAERERAEREAQVKDDKQLIEGGYKFEYDAQSHLAQDDLPEAVKNFLIEGDSDQVQAINYLINQAVNKLVGDHSKFSEAQERVGKFDAEQAEQQRVTVVETLQKRGIEPKVFDSKEFKSFEQDPKNFAKLDSFEERFGFGSVEYAHSVHDAFKASQTARKAETARTAKQIADAERQKVSDGQKALDNSQVSGTGGTEAQPDDPDSPGAKLAAYRKSKARAF